MPENGTLTRTDATGRIIRDWNNERKICADLEADYTNAGAQVYIAEQNLRRAEGERDGLMRERERIDDDLAVLLSEMEKESRQGRKAEIRGAKIFGPIGGIIGVPVGPGAVMGLGAAGMRVGRTLGYALEETGDALNPNTRTDFTLDYELKKLLIKRRNI